MHKIALVSNWFSKDIKGGAEQQCWQIANRLAEKNIEVHVLTTCSKSFHDSWDKNFYKKGCKKEGQIFIHRFKVNRRNSRLFNESVSHLLSMDTKLLKMGHKEIEPSIEKNYLDNNICSDDLLNFLKKNRENFSSFLFIPYLFPLSIKGAKIVGHKAMLQLCLHDEPYAYLNCVRESIIHSGKLLFNSKGEFELAKRIYGKSIASKSVVVSEGVEIEFDSLPHSEIPLIDGPYLLYLGKRCKEKNVDLLICSFARFVKRFSSEWKLVLAGADPLPLKVDSDKIIDLGFVTSAEKENLLLNAKMIVNLSVNESFSRLIFEAWMAKKPVLVHKKCLATYSSMVDAGDAGWAVSDTVSIMNFLQKLDVLGDSELEAKGLLGYKYACVNANWGYTIQKYVSLSENLPLQKTIHLAVVLRSAYGLDEANCLQFIEENETYGFELSFFSKHKPRLASLQEKQLDWKYFSTENDFFILFGDESWKQLDDAIKSIDISQKIAFTEKVAIEDNSISELSEMSKLRECAVKPNIFYSNSLYNEVNQLHEEAYEESTFHGMILGVYTFSCNKETLERIERVENEIKILTKGIRIKWKIFFVELNDTLEASSQANCDSFSIYNSGINEVKAEMLSCDLLVSFEKIVLRSLEIIAYNVKTPILLFPFFSIQTEENLFNESIQSVAYDIFMLFCDDSFLENSDYLEVSSQIRTRYSNEKIMWNEDLKKSFHSTMP